MNLSAIQAMPRTTPFEPFKFTLSSGERVPVRHPQFVILTRDRTVVALPPERSNELPDDITSISCLHVAGARPSRAGRRGTASRTRH